MLNNPDNYPRVLWNSERFHSWQSIEQTRKHTHTHTHNIARSEELHKNGGATPVSVYLLVKSGVVNCPSLAIILHYLAFHTQNHTDLLSIWFGLAFWLVIFSLYVKYQSMQMNRCKPDYRLSFATHKRWVTKDGLYSNTVSHENILQFAFSLGVLMLVD